MPKKAGEFKAIEDRKLIRIHYLASMVMRENARQLEKWGVQCHSPHIWMTALTEEVGELAQCILADTFGSKNHGGGNADLVEEAIHVATLALKIAEMYLPDLRYCEPDKAQALSRAKRRKK